MANFFNNLPAAPSRENFFIKLRSGQPDIKIEEKKPELLHIDFDLTKNLFGTSETTPTTAFSTPEPFGEKERREQIKKAREKIPEKADLIRQVEEAERKAKERQFLPAFKQEAKDILQSTARNIASFGVTTGKLLGGAEISDTQLPESFKKIFGEEEPIESLEERMKKMGPKLKAWGEQPEEGLVKTPLKAIARTFPETLSFFAVLGSVGLDLTPFGGVQKNVFTALKKVDNIADGIKLLKNMGISDDLAKQFSEDVVLVSSDKEAKDLLFRVAESQMKEKLGTVPTLDTIKEQARLIAQQIDKEGGDVETASNILSKIEGSQAPLEAQQLFGQLRTMAAGKEAEKLAQVKIAEEIPPTVPPAIKGAAKEIPPGKEERGFLESVELSPNVPQEVKDRLQKLPEESRFYDVFTDKEAIDGAREKINNDLNLALSEVLTTKELTKDTVALGIELMKGLGQSKNFELEARIAEHLAELGTQGGQFVQAYSLLNKLSPEGVLVFATKRLRRDIAPEKITELDTLTRNVVQRLHQANVEVAEELVKKVEASEFKIEVPKKEGLDPSDPAERLAAKITPYMKSREPNPITDMINTLFKVAQESLPPKVKKVPRHPIELIGEAIQDKATYKEVWVKAQGLVREKYLNNEDALSLLDDFFGKVLDRPFSKRQVTGAVRRGIKETEINLGKLVRKHFSEVEGKREELADKLVKQAGITLEEAKKLSKTLTDEFNVLATVKKESILASMFKERIFKKKEVTDRIIELSNLGAFNSEKYRPLVAQKLGIPTLSKELAKKLVAQANKIQETPYGFNKIKETHKLLQMIAVETPLKSRTTDITWELINVPRALMSSMDVSFGLRQGALGLTRAPGDWWEGFKRQFKAGFSEEAYDALMDGIMKHPDFSLAVESGVAFTDVNAKLTLREERFMSRLAEKIPIIGKGVTFSSRAYTAFANKLRMDLFSRLSKNADIMESASSKKDIAELVNDMTGRGGLNLFGITPKIGQHLLESAAPLLNAVFFSPRLMASRLNLLIPGRYIKSDSFVRKEYVKTMLAYGGSVTALLGLLDLVPGVEIGKDMRSADFGKVKIGNTRIDLSAGFQPYLRVAAQLATGKYVSSSTGKVITLGEGFKPLTRFDIALRFLETKEAPILSFISTVLKEQEPTGDKVNWPKAVVERFTPMFLQDLWEVSQEDPELLPLGFLSALGVGIQSYGPPEAYQKLNEIKSSPDPARAYLDLKKENPMLAQKVDRAGLESTFSEFDWGLTYMGVESGQRAKFLNEHFSSLLTQERISLYKDLRRKKLLSDKVDEQLKFLYKHPEFIEKIK